MSKSLISHLSLAGILALFCFGFYAPALAQNAAAPAPINAEILSSVWFSATTINEKDTINIYAGFQNHSSKNLAGTAGFYVDDLEIKKVDFTSSSQSLIKLGTPYVAVAGDHTAQVKILSTEEAGSNPDTSLSINNLLATESEKKDFSAIKIKSPVAQQALLGTIGDVANTVASTGNQYADTLANYVEGLKIPTENSQASIGTALLDKAKTLIPGQNSTNPTGGKVLSASTENPLTTKSNGKELSFSGTLYNMLIDAAAFLLRQWVWTLAVILLLIIYWIFKRH